MFSFRSLRQCSYLGIVLAILSIPLTFAYAQKPDSVKVMNKLKNKPIYEHGSMYQEILEDTSLLTHPGLTKQLLNVGRKGWLEQYIWPDRFTGKEGRDSLPDWFRDQNVGRPWMKFQGVLSQIPNEGHGYQALELKLYIAGHSLYWDDELLKQIKRDPHTLLVLTRTGSKFRYKDYSPQTLIFGGMDTNRAIYECYRLYRDKLPSDVEKEIIEWAWNTIEGSGHLTSLRSTAMAILLENGISENEIKKKYQFNVDTLLGEDEPMNEDEWARSELIDAKKMINKYPKWPMENIDTTLPKDFGDDIFDDYEKDEAEDETETGPPDDTPGKGPQDNGAEDDNDGDDERESKRRNNQGQKDD